MATKARGGDGQSAVSRKRRGERPLLVFWKGNPQQALSPAQYARVVSGDSSVLSEIPRRLYRKINPKRSALQPYEHQRRMYQHTDNPLWVWEAYRLCRHTRTPVPDWLLVAFDTFADDLKALSQDENPKGVGTWQIRVLRALGFGRSRSTRERNTDRASRLLDSYENTTDSRQREALRRRIGALFEKPGKSGGPQNPIDAWTRDRKAAALAAHARNHAETHHVKIDPACAAVATELGVSKASVWRAWKAFRRAVAISFVGAS
jgi:hypothetical protein